jgi:multisubunit Na+/H+ antiporter MnhB subunit
LIAAAADLPIAHPGLAGEVAKTIEAASLPPQPVTTVLLVLRGYDTWLELGVLLLAVMGVLVLGAPGGHDATETGGHDPILTTFTLLIVSATVLLAGHLLLLGMRSPGGAFQAGAAAAAGLVLAHLAGLKISTRVSEQAFRVGVAMAFGLPLMLTAIMLAAGEPFLGYPEQEIVGWVLLFETAIMVSAGMSLAALFVVAGSIAPAPIQRPGPHFRG